MEERDAHVISAGAGDFVDHAHAGLLQLGDTFLQAGDGESDMVKSFARFSKKAATVLDGSVGSSNSRRNVADAEEGDADLLIGNHLDALEYGAERAFVEGRWASMERTAMPMWLTALTGVIGLSCGPTLLVVLALGSSASGPYTGE